MADPRAQNCRAYVEQGGLVMGVELAYVEVPTSRFQLINASLIDEKTQGPGGPTIAWYHILDKSNQPVYDQKAKLAWAWPELDDGEGDPGTPGQHMITNGFDPNKGIGPLEIHLEDAAGMLISDRIAGLGLPNNHHVSFTLTFKERGDTVVTPGGGGSCDLAPVMEELADIKALVIGIAKHFSA